MTRLTPAAFALLGSTFAATAALAGALAKDPPAPQPVVQLGDRDLSCQALQTAIADASQAQARKADQAAHSRRMFGFATAALQMAAPLAGDLGGGSSAASLIGTVAQQGALSAVRSAAPAAPASDDARSDRLTALFDAKGC